MPARIHFPTPASPSPLLVTGSIAYDDIITPRESARDCLGGSATYAAFAASRFTTTQLVGIVGADFAENDRERLRAHQVDTAALQTDPGGKTLRWRGKYHENHNQRDTLGIQLGVFENYHPTLPPTHTRTPYVLLANIAPALQLHVLNQVHSPKFVLADTMNHWMDTARNTLWQVISRAHLLVLNDTEATHLTGEANLIRAGRHLMGHPSGPQSLIIKKGEHGSLFFHRNGIFALPAYPVENLRDPTGAGDTYAGALLGVLAARRRTDATAIKQAMLYATALASLTLEDFSSVRLEAATTTEMESRVARLREMVNPDA
jgi:sugar/nucleoside kinase (ribokinase family)